MTALTVGEMISILKNHDPSLVLVFRNQTLDKDCVLYNLTEAQEDTIEFEESGGEKTLKVLRFNGLENDIYYHMLD